MSQQVNLYQPIFRQQEKVFSARTIAQAAALVFVGLLVLYGYARWQGHQQNRELAQLQSQQDAMLKRLEGFAAEFPPRQKSQQLEQDVERMAAELAGKRRALAALSGGIAGNTGGFSTHLEALARQRVEGMWLTGFALGNGGTQVGLRGSALQPELIPRFLQRLSDERAFAGSEFETFQMTRAEQDPARIDFALQTTGPLEE